MSCSSWRPGRWGCWRRGWGRWRGCRWAACSRTQLLGCCSGLFPQVGCLQERVVSANAPSIIIISSSDGSCLSTSMQAVGPAGDLLFTSLLYGTVLCNGRYPGRLTREVTQHPLFVRTFEEATNSEVRVTREDVMRTLRPVAGRHCDFSLRLAARAVLGSNR